MTAPRRAACACALAVVLAGLVLAPSAGAHAFLVRSSPAVGSAIARPPTRVVLGFSEPVAVLAGTDVVGPRGASELGGEPYVPPRRRSTIVLPLAHGLRDGRYLVRWREVDTGDGHELGGSFEFVIGSGTVARGVVTSGGFSLRMAAARWLLILGVFLAGGYVAFRHLVLLPSVSDLAVRAREARATALTLAPALAAVALGAGVLLALEPGTRSTGYAHRMLVGGAVGAAGLVAALIAYRRAATLVVAEVAAVVVLALPTATSHAAAGPKSQALSIADDVVHVVAGAVWFGGVAALAIVVPRLLRALEPVESRATLTASARRFAALAAGALVLLGATGLVRAVEQLGSVSQLWTTGYGRALVVKTALLAVAGALARYNRGRLAQRVLRPELGILVVLVGAVAVLTELNPGHTPAVAVASATESPLVLAGQAGDLAVGVAITPHDAANAQVHAMVIGQQGPQSGLVVRFVALGGARRTRSCGVGCYTALVPLTRGRPQLAVVIGSPPRIARFAAPAKWPAPDATVLLYRVDAAWRRLRSLTAVTRIASDPRHEVTTLSRYGRPDRISYAIVPPGAQAVVIGNRRWDRASPRGRWQESTQDPVHQPTPPWFSGATADAHLLGSETIAGRRLLRLSFVDRSVPAWFTLLVDAETYRTASLSMIAQAHFMRQDNADFNAAAPVDPPS